MGTPRPIKRILVGTGLTPESVGGVLLARWLAGRLGAGLHAVQHSFTTRQCAREESALRRWRSGML